jgi:hypothetical protein
VIRGICYYSSTTLLVSPWTEGLELIGLNEPEDDPGTARVAPADGREAENYA